MLSVIIPSYKDPFLQKTIDSLLENAQGEIEIIPVLDGYTLETPIKSDSRIRVISLAKNLGMRGAINAGLAKARGKHIMKCDSHCLFGPGYDKILTKNCAENWLIIPRRYSVDEVNWLRNETRPVVDYYYLNFPTNHPYYGIDLSIIGWQRKERLDPKFDIDDTMIFQGSCWLANKKFFMKRVGFLDDRKRTYGSFSGDQLEIGLKYWLSGAEIKVNKKTWYAHLNKRPHHYKQGIFTRDYKINSSTARTRTWSTKHWMNNKELGMIHPFSWLLEKFWPVPTWPEDRSLWVFLK